MSENKCWGRSASEDWVSQQSAFLYGCLVSRVVVFVSVYISACLVNSWLSAKIPNVLEKTNKINKCT